MMWFSLYLHAKTQEVNVTELKKEYIGILITFKGNDGLVIHRYLNHWNQFL